MSERLATLLLVLLTCASTIARAGAPEIDPHALFEARCATCHGHAGDLARERLQVVEGELVSRGTGRPVAPFLSGHMGRPTEAEVAALALMMRRQVESGALYEERCRICHDRARELARLELIIQNGVLLGRYSGRDIAEFLQEHGRSTAEEAALLSDMLRWQRQVLQ